jgi:hypothetical protein
LNFISSSARSRAGEPIEQSADYSRTFDADSLKIIKVIGCNELGGSRRLPGVGAGVIALRRCTHAVTTLIKVNQLENERDTNCNAAPM